MSSGSGVVANSDRLNMGAEGPLLAHSGPKRAELRSAEDALLNRSLPVGFATVYQDTSDSKEPGQFRAYCAALNNFKQAIDSLSEYKEEGLAILSCLVELAFADPKLAFKELANKLVGKSDQQAMRYKHALINLFKGVFARQMVEDFPSILTEYGRLQALECLCTFLRKDPDSGVRVEAVKGLSRVLLRADWGAYINVLLASFYISEPSAEVRAAARNLRRQSLDLLPSD